MALSTRQQGFTLLEILVATALSLMIITAGYLFYTSQIQTRITQERVADMQQNLRAVMTLMEDDLRMAGYDPNGATGAAITNATQGTITFQMSLDADANGLDDDGDSQVDEADEALLMDVISYGLGGGMVLQRTLNGGTPVVVAENIQGLELNYLMEDGSFTGTPPDLSQIVAIRYAVLARVIREEDGFTNGVQYTGYTQQWGAYDDGFRRRILRRTVKCRNRGI